MLTLDAFGEQALTWIPSTSRSRGYELCASGEIFATLHWTQPGTMLATARAADGRWIFRQETTPHSFVTIWPAQPAAGHAVFEPGSGGGILGLPDGQIFHWGCTRGLDRSEWVNNGPLLRIRKETSAGRNIGHVAIEPAASVLQWLSLLALLGWYLMGPVTADSLVPALTPGRATIGMLVQTGIEG